MKKIYKNLNNQKNIKIDINYKLNYQILVKVKYLNLKHKILQQKELLIICHLN